MLSVTYTLFAKIIMNRILPTLESDQLTERAGHCGELPATGHIHVSNQAVEKTTKCKTMLCMAFTDHEKALLAASLHD